MTPPPPTPPPSTTVLCTILIIIIMTVVVVANTTTNTHCPPFNSSILEYPFSNKQGYGHPYFHIKCTSPHSLISINNQSFTLLNYHNSSKTLKLSPITHQLFNFSGSPFRVSKSSCSRLQAIESCNSSQCLWEECKLMKNQLQILQQYCGSYTYTTTRVNANVTKLCRTNVFGYLDRFFKQGIDVVFQDVHDPYFVSCKGCKSTNGLCGYNSSDPSNKFMCYESKLTAIPVSLITRGNSNSNRVAILSSVLGLSCVFLAISLVIAVFRSKRMTFRSLEEDPTTIFLQRHRAACLLPPVITYEELETSTNKFDLKRKIGDGGFGSVYLGQLFDGRIVAVKYLHRFHNIAANGNTEAFVTKSFCNEILILSSIDHPNLVKLHGYCSDPRGMVLVYDYVPNGTLADHLHGPNRNQATLTWQVRLDIALQIALAIEYLHLSVVPAIVHRDITCSNIFVERDMRIKVGDFGLSRLLVSHETSSSAGYVWTGPQGTPGYLDPDYHRSFRLTEKSDIYSYGVVLLELITGLRPVDQRRDKREISLADLVVAKIQMGLLHQVVDPLLPLDGGVDALAELAFRCVAIEKDDRPDAREIVEELKRIRSCRRGG